METRNKIEKFEDLIAWQKARQLTAKIYQISRKGEFGKDFRLSGQIQGTAVSIMSNVAEGFERGQLGESTNSFQPQKVRVLQCDRNRMSHLMSLTLILLHLKRQGLSQRR